MRGFLELSRAYLLQTWRSKTALFWTLGFPQVWLFAFAFIFGGGTPDGVTALMPNVFAITIFAGSFFGVSYSMVTERENGILRRYRVTPVTALTVVLANGSRSVANVATSVALQALLAWLIFDIRIGSPGLMIVAIGCGVIAFVPLGLILGSVAKDMRSAPALGNLIFFPMMFLSGAAIPLQLLPGWLIPVARVLPASYLTDALHAAIVRNQRVTEVPGLLAAMLVAGAAAAGANSLLFRWESTEPIDAGRAFLATVGLLGVYVAVALLAPPLQAASPAPAAEAVAVTVVAEPTAGDGTPSGP